MRQKTLILFFYVLCGLLMAGVCHGQGKGLLPHKKLTQYSYHTWMTEDGLPNNAVIDIVQSKKGYLWLGTYEGLVRFDGVRFFTFNKSNVDEIKVNGVNAILETQDHKLWSGSNGGGVFIADEYGHIRAFEQNALLPNLVVTDLFQDSRGRVWVGTRRGLRYYHEGRLQIPADSLLSNYSSINSIAEDALGAIWVGTTGDGLFSITDDGKVNRYNEKNGLSVYDVRVVYFDHQKRLWLGTEKGAVQFNFKKRSKWYTQEGGLPSGVVNTLFEDSNNNFWIGTERGLARAKRNGEIEYIAARPGFLQDYAIESIFEGREGELWVGTYRGGVTRIFNGKFLNYSEQEGLHDDLINAAVEDAARNIWVGTDEGVDVIKPDGNIQNIHPEGMPKTRFRDIIIGRDGLVWMATYKGVIRLNPKNQEIIIFDKSKGLSNNSVRIVYEDSKGNIWAGTKNGLNKITEDSIRVYDTKSGLSSAYIMAVHEDGEGGLWVGTNGGGLNRVFNDKIEVYNSSNSGLSSDVVFRITKDKDGKTLLMGGNSGFARISGTEITEYSEKQGVFGNSVFQVLYDGRQGYWFTTDENLFYMEEEYMAKLFAGDSLSNAPYKRFGKLDGMKASECTSTSKGSVTADGRVLVPTLGGLEIVTPGHIMENYLPPNIVLERIEADKDEINLNELVVVNPGVQKVGISFTALSFIAPEKMEILYMLEGFDRDWVRVEENRRNCYYTNLPADTYNFKIKAKNNDGVWDRQDFAFRFQIEPRFYETPWFIAFVVLVLAVLVYWLVRVRVKVLEAEKDKLEKVVEDRTKEIQEKSAELQSSMQKLSHSINYASKIQTSTLPDIEKIKSLLPDSFVMYKPRDVVSGDFFWYYPLDDRRFYIAAIDCTGHGVPGAFMTLMANVILNDLMAVGSIQGPAHLITELDKKVKFTLKQNIKDKNQVRDGMDISVCLVDLDKGGLIFSGAKSPLYVVRGNGKEYYYKGSIFPVGSAQYKYEKVFEDLAIDLNPDDTVYLYSDGFQDQTGGPEGRKYLSRRFRKFLRDIAAQPLERQGALLESEYQVWKGNKGKQIDDILVIGFRVS